MAAGALALAGCTSDSGSGDTGAEGGGEGDSSEESAGSGEESEGDMGGEEGSTALADMGEVTTNDDTVSFSSGAEEYNAYNGNTANTNSTYNAVVNNQLHSGFWYWGTDGTIYPNEWFGSYEQTSEDPLTVEYTISDDAVWSDGTPITSNDFLLAWASTNPESMGGAETLGFDPVSTWSTYATDGLETEPSSKTFTVVYPEPYPDWEIAVEPPLPAHIAAEQGGMEPDELAQAILDGEGETVAEVSEFWNDGWLFPNYQVEDEAWCPRVGPTPSRVRPGRAATNSRWSPTSPSSARPRPPATWSTSSPPRRPTCKRCRTVTSTSSSRRPPSTHGSSSRAWATWCRLKVTSR
ncbi:hypothetical protein BJF82_15145 [Kytococcus sp. CUA-901]|nr:hypothetical protein BJF82_15145 [Kytococcus sp. CUA-901]